MAFDPHRSNSSRARTGRTAEGWLSLDHAISVVKDSGLLWRRVATRAGLRGGIREQWQRVRAGLGADTPATDDMEVMYRAELHELHSAELQFCALLDGLWVTLGNGALALRISEYAAALRVRGMDLESLLIGKGEDTRQRPDEAMRALVGKVTRTAQLSGAQLRDAAVVAAIQRIIHHMIAEHGTAAAHAKVLGHMDEAARFAQYADRDKVVDAELSELARNTLNPQATGSTEQAESDATR